MSRLLDHLAAWKPFRAIVVGDYMLDQLVYGNADRLSPEAPVPVLHVQKSEDRPGGAANVCLDLVAMRGEVQAIGVCGDDREADLLRSALAAAGVESSGLVSDAARPTTVKRSLIGLAQHRHPQKMFRVDYESREPLSTEVESQLIARFEAALAGADVVCIEDYNKGVCTERFCQAVIGLCKARGVPVLVDPAAVEDYSKYRGCTTITPNRSEAALATAIAVASDATPLEHAAIAERLLRSLEMECAVITLDRHGALLLERGKAPIAVPTVARQVYDVTGAGDMVLAALAGARANAIDWPDAVRLANAAAGLEVEVFGVVPMPIEKIHREVMRLDHADSGGKVRTVQQIVVDVAALRKGVDRGKPAPRVVFANGCFDVLHLGHMSMLQKARELGEYLVVAVNEDDSVRRLKGPDRPVYTASVRAAMLAALECVDAVVTFPQDTAVELINMIRPDVLVKGDQYDESKVPEAVAIKALGGKVEFVDVVPGHSTTSVVGRMKGTGAALPRG